MEDEKVKQEKQRNIMYMLFGQYVYISIIEFVYSSNKICYFSHLALNRSV